MAIGKGFRGDPTARRRRAPDEVLLAAQEVIRRHGAGESRRSIARGLGLARTSVDRIVAEYQAAQLGADDAELGAELDALVSKYEGGVPAGFGVDDADPVLVAELVASGVDVEHEDALAVLAALTRDPGDALARWRIGHLPRTAEWWAGRNKLGQLLTEEAEIKAKLAAGWRYREGAWHPPA